MTKLQAHRGVSSSYPENTMSAFKASKLEGYDLIEFDPKYTKDNQLVILHDWTINRTGRNLDGTEISQEINIKDLTLQEAKNYDYGVYMGDQFKGEQLPLFKDLLEFASQNNIPIKVDNVWEKFPKEIVEKMFAELKAYEERITFGMTCNQLADIQLVVDTFKNAEIHYDGGDLSTEQLIKVKKICKNRKLYIWVCFDNELTKWFQGTKATKEVCKFVKNFGELGVWILSKPSELKTAVQDYHADVVETTGHLKPEHLNSL